MLEFLCNKVAGLEPATLVIFKKRLQHKCLPVNFAKFFRRPTSEENLQAAAFGNAFLCNFSGRLLLHSNLPIAGMLYKGHLVIVDIFLRNRPNHGQTNHGYYYYYYYYLLFLLFSSGKVFSKSYLQK